MLRRSLAIVIAAGALAACATSAIDPQAKATIPTVYVERAEVAKASVFSPTAREAVGAAPATVAEATAQMQQVLDARVGLARQIEAEAMKKLIASGYRVVVDPAQASARLKFVVNHALSIAGSNDKRGIAMTISAELTRTADDKRMLFAVANAVKDPAAHGVRLEPYAAWFGNGDLAAEQYKLVARLLTAQVLEGL